MRKLSLLLVLLAVVGGVVWLVRARSSDERELRRLMDEVQMAALAALNGRDPDALDVYFATEAEGAQAAGLGEVKQAFKTFVSQLPNDSAVQFHSFDIDEVEVHESDGLARVTYRLHFSVVRGNTAIYSAKATQNLALLRTPRGWRISGGDAAQLAEVTGVWPPR
jgi:trehalose-6-phosphatase